MGVDIDESRANHQSPGIYDVPGLRPRRWRNRPDVDNGVSNDGNVRFNRVGARPVHHAAIYDHEIVSGTLFAACTGKSK
jgi:hypothetical protein